MNYEHILKFLHKNFNSIPYEELLWFLCVAENDFENMSGKPKSHLGKIGLAIMVIGLGVLYYDGIKLIQEVPVGYQFYEHPQIHIPIIFIIVAFVGVGIFVYNFSKGRNVI